MLETLQAVFFRTGVPAGWVGFKRWTDMKERKVIIIIIIIIILISTECSLIKILA